MSNVGFSRSEGTQRFKPVARQEQSVDETEGGGLKEGTDAFAGFPTGEFEPIELADDSSWMEIERALLGEDAGDLKRNFALIAHRELPGSTRSVLIALSEKGPMVVDDRPLGTDADHGAAEGFGADIVSVFSSVALETGVSVWIEDQLAYVCVLDGLWLSVSAHSVSTLGRVVSAINTLREAPDE